MENIVQRCVTGIGDCVVGFVSVYILKSQIETRYFNNNQKINIYLDWITKCPYVRDKYIWRNNKGLYPIRRINCLFSGDDGTLSFNSYYHGHHFINDVKRKKTLNILINQYVGRCFIDDHTSREEIKMLTYQAYNYFWNEVIDQNKIPLNVRNQLDDIDYTVIYIRLGDEYIGGSCMKIKSDLYESLKNIRITGTILLLGDADNEKLRERFISTYPEYKNNVLLCNGKIEHSLVCHNIESWEKILSDLYMILKANQLIILSNCSNFPRITMFLNTSTKRNIYYPINNELKLISDNSTVFAKHYTF